MKPEVSGRVRNNMGVSIPAGQDESSRVVTLQEASDATGLNRSTIFRAIKAGKISAVRNEQGTWQIEPSELHRVYAPLATPDVSTARTHQDAMADKMGATARAPARRHAAGT
jgi:hypothetical protein